MGSKAVLGPCPETEHGIESMENGELQRYISRVWDRLTNPQGFLHYFDSFELSSLRLFLFAFFYFSSSLKRTCAL
jgi:hypothetical protein